MACSFSWSSEWPGNTPDADGTRTTTSFVQPAEPYSCSASDGPGFSLGGGLGLDLDVGREVSFISQLSATAYRQTSDTIGSCAPGSGSVTGIGASIGFAYRFDLGDEPARASNDTPSFKRGSSDSLR